MTGTRPTEPPVLSCGDPGFDSCPISGGTCTGECIFASVMESQRLGVVVLDLGAHSVLFVNRSARDLLVRLGQETTYSALVGLLLGGDERVEDMPALRDAGVRIGTRLLGYTVYRKQSYAWIFLRDITEKARLESIAEAVETMNSIGYVFAAVRHELGNPVNSVKAALSVLRSNLKTFPPEAVADYVDRMSAEIGRVEVLLRSLKSFSMYETPELRAVELREFFRGLRGLVATEVERRRLSLEFTAPDPCWAKCDPRALQQVLLNLFANAADALAGHPSPQIRIAATAADGIVTITVGDNGPGVPPEERPNLFKPFHTTKERGTGLGLVVSRKMLARMGGTIDIESEPGSGARAVLTLPEVPPAV